MKANFVLTAIFCLSGLRASAQNAAVEQFLTDAAVQDSIIATIVPNHALMSKLIEKISERPGLNAMVIQHLTRLLNEKSGGAAQHHHDAHGTMSRYAGDESREIKSLSADEVKGLLEGEGIGLAMAAELNHYLGPRHVLDLGNDLGLTETQKKTSQAYFDRMHARAVRIGTKLLQKEEELDKAFASGTIRPESLNRLTGEIEVLRGRLRNTHLAAHLDEKNVLTPGQIVAYDRLRGYAGK